MQFIKLTEVINLTGLSRSSIYRGMRHGNFPATIHISARAVAWDKVEVLQWMQDCVEHPKVSAH